jgi:1,4-alpha-glucan branching enzyme
MSLKKTFLKTEPICKVTFSLPVEQAGEAEQVVLLGDFNGWNRAKAIPMNQVDGVYRATVRLPIGKDYQFRYLIDDERWENDDTADRYSPNPFGQDNSIVMAVDGVEME